MPKLIFISPAGERAEIDAPEGSTVLEVARQHGIDIEGACEGSLACATCHVVVDPPWFEALLPADTDEEDMLDLAYGVTPTSRLGCQIVMRPEYDGLVLRLPHVNHRNR